MLNFIFGVVIGVVVGVVVGYFVRKNNTEKFDATASKVEKIINKVK